ncbi:MAG: dTDP-4-dehydrorhamnose reductase [Streptosporangiaceae bacterium]|nr:dTDP-4-dehydrorhamnose reductase [Streptosporangiaceae bacterium]
MSRWLITGAAGMLGRDLVSVLERGGETVTALTRAELDITDGAAVRDALRHWRPAVVANCAAWTAVDAAETSEDAALRLNGQAVADLAVACAAAGVRLIQPSTDYVFDGQARRPYAEDDVPAPGTAYGRTKLAGEQAVLDRLDGTGYVVRTAWLYGAHGPNFVRTMIRLEQQRPDLDVVDDQHGQPTWTMDVADRIVALVSSGAPAGVYHATSSGETTWFGLAQEVFRLLGADPDRVRPVGSAAYVRPAPRPAYSVLGHDAWSRAGLSPIGDWRLALRQAFPALAATEGAGPRRA